MSVFVGKYNKWDKVDPAELFSQAPTEKKEANPKLNMVKFLQVRPELEGAPPARPPPRALRPTPPPQSAWAPRHPGQHPAFKIVWWW